VLLAAEKIPVEPEAGNTDEGIKISSRLLNKGPFFLTIEWYQFRYVFL
jgi:hypothetical protein